MIVTDIHNWQTKEGFEILFKQYYEPLCAFVYGVVKDYDESEEIIQDMFVKIWERREQIPTDSSIKAYLYRAARNMAINQLKHIEIKDNYKQYNKEEIAYAEQESWDSTEENELSHKIRQAIEKLPPERKKIFLMSRDNDLKYKEIADELNISIKTVENQMGKALATLRTELAEYLPAVIITIILGMK